MKIFNMKLGSIQYLIKEGFKGAWANRLMSLASVGVLVACMVVIGLAILISENVSLAVGTLEKQNVVMVYMKDYNWALYSDSAEIPEGKRDGADKNGILASDYVIHDEEEAKVLCDKIASLDNVVSAEFISSEQGLEDVKGSMVEGQEEYFTFLDDEYGNPISAAAKVTMESTSPALFNKTIEEIKLNRLDLVRDKSSQWKCTLALKGARTLIGAGDNVYINSTGNAGMATAGAGDVLAGIIAGLWAGRMNAREAALLGVYLHGLAGDLACRAKGELGLIASDLIEFLPEAVLSLLYFS